MKTLATVIVAIIFFCVPEQSVAANDYVTFAKSLLARDYDSSLPAISIEQWLESILPRGTGIVWGNNETDCGEQTGDPSIDKERDMPLCVEVTLVQENRTVGYLSLFVGTDKKGKLKNSAGLYYGFIKEGEKTIDLKNLRELKKLNRI